jgi:hypothetical protein
MHVTFRSCRCAELGPRLWRPAGSVMLRAMTSALKGLTDRVREGSKNSTARRVAAAVALFMCCAGCTAPASQVPSPAAPATTVTSQASGSAAPNNAIQMPSAQRLPREWRKVRWDSLPVLGRWRRPPDQIARLVSVLDAPTHAARLVYHPVERLTDQRGWSGERLVLLGADGEWRHLNMADLRLPASWWPGPDTYGPGDLSADGRTWAAHTNAGVVFLDLTTGSVRHVDLPRKKQRVRYVSWVPGKDVVSAYATNKQARRYWTFHVSAAGEVRPVAYEGATTRFDTDGTPVSIRTEGRHLTLSGYQPSGVRTARFELPVRFHRANPFGHFGHRDVAMIQPTPGWIDDAQKVWVFDKHNGTPRARLRVPAATGIEGWTDGGALILLTQNRHLISWEPHTGRIRRLVEFPGPYPAPAEWAAMSVTLAGAFLGSG